MGRGDRWQMTRYCQPAFTSLARNWAKNWDWVAAHRYFGAFGLHWLFIFSDSGHAGGLQLTPASPLTRSNDPFVAFLGFFCALTGPNPVKFAVSIFSNYP